MEHLKIDKTWFRFQRGENESFYKYTPTCVFSPTLNKNHKTTTNTHVPVQRGENESNNIVLSCESPRREIKQKKIIKRKSKTG